MNTRMVAQLVACALLLSAAFRLNAATNASWTTSALLKQLRDEGNRPINPVCIASNLYHVGAVNLAVFLLASPEGHILIDSGYEETVPLIRTNVERLGFKMKDVKIILSSHAHMDHVAGHAALQRLTGARIMAMKGDAEILEAGGKGDFRWEAEAGWEPVKVDRVLHDGDKVTLGGNTLVAHLTPGHTRGNTTWTMQALVNGRKLDVVFAGSPNINDGVTLLKNPKYPGIREDYLTTFRVLKSLPCDLFLNDHGQAFQIERKTREVESGAKTNPFIDPAGYKAFVERAERVFQQQLARESSPQAQ